MSLLLQHSTLVTSSENLNTVNHGDDDWSGPHEKIVINNCLVDLRHVRRPMLRSVGDTAVLEHAYICPVEHLPLEYRFYVKRMALLRRWYRLKSTPQRWRRRLLHGRRYDY